MESSHRLLLLLKVKEEYTMEELSKEQRKRLRESLANMEAQEVPLFDIDSENNYIRKKEKIELSLLQFRKNICLPENAKEKAQYEEEMAEWLGIESCVVSPLTEEEEERLKYLEKKLSDADNGI